MASVPESKYKIRAKLIQWIIRILLGTCRIRVDGEENLNRFQREKIPLIYIFWHRHIFLFISFFRNSGAHPLISHSQDGSLIARVAQQFGMKPIRGSSSLGGARAFLELVNRLTIQKESVLITADGPKGPARIVKEGVIRLAEKTGFPVVPISWYSSRVKIFSKSWDRFLLPLPFSRIHLCIGESLHLDRLRTAEAGYTASILESIRIQWQDQLNLLEREAMTKAEGKEHI